MRDSGSTEILQFHPQGPSNSVLKVHVYGWGTAQHNAASLHEEESTSSDAKVRPEENQIRI